MIGRSWTVRVRIGFVLAVSMMGATWTGCGTGDFVPPPPPEPGEAIESGAGVPAAMGPKAATAPAAAGSTTRRIEFIASHQLGPDEAAVEFAAARTQAGYDRVRLHIVPDDDDGSSPGASAAREKSQAELIRGSLAGKPAALIVDPDDPADKELARAVQEARAAKVPVVVIGRPIAGAGEAKAPGAAPMILVAPHPFADSARRIVEVSIRNLKNDKVDPARGAVILVTISGDRLSSERLAALREALAAAKITAVSELRIPKDLEAASAMLTKRLKEDPKPAMVLFTDYNGALASNKVAGEIGEKHPFVQAGYSADENRVRMVMAGSFAVLAEYEPPRLIRKAVTVAIAAAQGRESREKEEVPINILESPAGTGLPHVQAKRGTMMEIMKGEQKSN